MRPEVLLIDDERDFVDLLAQRLEARDHPALAAYDAAGGIGLMEQGALPVVVLDVNLPDRGGLEVLEEIRRRWPLTQVVMLTGQIDLGTAVAGMKLGALDYLVKPTDVEALVRAIVRAKGRFREQSESLRVADTARMASLGRLAGGVAHELLNPVNTIMQKAGWAAELMEEPEFQACPGLPEVLAELKGIEAQSRRCKEVVGTLMRMGGRIDPRPSEFEMSQVLEAVAAQVEARARERGVRVAVFCEPGLPRVTLPRAEIEQVLRLLADNALEAMALRTAGNPARKPDGAPGHAGESSAGSVGPGGLLSLGAFLGEGGVLEARVEDTGPGVPEEIAPHIFEPFFSTKDVGQGAGLGLSACKGIMRSLGGDVLLERAGGPGAVFRVLAPLPGAAPGA
ncbi:Sensor kinase CckA [Fundidesulfovibrio magnetotacticus]|uniref:histidine kinase n=1 Tax=Fundidesulfovibrio magnetotacticus TaxID=2730080 RepID=A0A6V8LM22_9BACT|nr:response regulator [Fundidesulfovibrio magnetotacticus]GFK93733.1 Sensor kinase CckA [Fundidesulfovibrio magnetotacticus]